MVLTIASATAGLQWGRACEDADRESSENVVSCHFLLQWGRACEDADSQWIGNRYAFRPVASMGPRL